MNPNSGPRFPSLCIVSLPQQRGGGWNPVPLPFRKARILAASIVGWAKEANANSQNPDPNSAPIGMSHRDDHGVDAATIVPQTIIGTASYLTDYATYADGGNKFNLGETGHNISETHLNAATGPNFVDYATDNELNDTQVQSGKYPGTYQNHYARQITTTSWGADGICRASGLAILLVDELMWPDTDVKQRLVEG